MNRKRRNNNRRVTINSILILMICVFILSSFFLFKNLQTRNSQDYTSKSFYYKSVELKAGDSLWTIAEKYNTDCNRSTKEYIQLLKEINGLSSDEIYAESYITVVYEPNQFVSDIR